MKNKIQDKNKLALKEYGVSFPYIMYIIFFCLKKIYKCTFLL